jgi:hypothetical protein
MYDKDKKEIPMLSDGTVIAMANQENSYTQKFIKLGDDLAKHLEMELPRIFDPSFGRPYPTIWCTLGYFCHDDFEITEEVKHTFEEIHTNPKYQNIIIDIDKIEIIEFPKRSLDNYTPYGSPFFL